MLSSDVSLRDLRDVNPVAPAAGEVLTFASGRWTPQAPAGATIKIVEIDLGSNPVTSGSFTFSDAAATGASKIRAWQEDGPYTGKGTNRDEAEMDALDCYGVATALFITIHWRVRPEGIHFDRFGVGRRLVSPVVGRFRFGYLLTA